MLPPFPTKAVARWRRAFFQSYSFEFEACGSGNIFLPLFNLLIFFCNATLPLFTFYTLESSIILIYHYHLLQILIHQEPVHSIIMAVVCLFVMPIYISH